MKKKILFGLLCIFVLTGLTACGGEEGVKVNSANALARKLASDSAVKINVSKDILLEEPIVVNGEKEIVGNGKIVAAIEDGEEKYMITVANGGKLIVGGSVKVDASSLMGGIHVQEGGSAVVQDKAVVMNASEVTANALVEGSFEVKGGTLKDANGHNIYNKKETVISGGEIVGSGNKYAGIYNEGTLSQTGGSVTKAYNNISNISGSTFTFEGGTNTKSVRDGVFVAEGATLKATKKDAIIEDAGARGILLHGKADIKVITVKGCGDTLIKVGKRGVLNLGNGILQEGNYHGVDNAGTMTMMGGNIQMNKNCGIVNTGTLKITGGTIASNENKGILNKHEGTADVTSAMVNFTSNKTAIANEDKAVFEFAKAKIMMSTQTNIYCYDGTINIHDASLNASTSNNVRIIDGVINMTNVEVKGNSQKSGTSHHGMMIEGGVVNAENVTISMTTGHGMRVKGGQFIGKNIVMHDINRVGISMGKHDYLEQEGLVDIDGLEIQSTNYANVWNEGGGTVKVKNAKLAVAGSNSVRVNDGRMELTNVTIPGHKEGSKDNIHGIYMEGGELVAKNVTINNTSGNALRNKNGKFVGTNIKMTNIKGQTAISNLPLDDDNKDGIIEIDGLTIKDSFSKNITLDSGVTTIKNATLGATGGNNIKMQNNAATLNLHNVKIEGQHDEAVANTHGIMVEGGNVFGENIQMYNVEACGIRCKLGVVDLKNVTMTDINQAAISNSKMVKDDVEVGVGKVTIDGLTTSKVGTNNITMDAGTVTIKNGELCKIESKNHNVKVAGTGVVNLDTVKIAGTTDAGRYGVIAEGGTAVLNNVEIYDLAKSGLHANRETSSIKGTNVTVKDAVYAITGSNGSITVDGFTTADISFNNILADSNLKVTIKNSTGEMGLCATPGHNAKATGDALVTLDNVEVKGVTDGSKHAIMAEGGDFALKDVVIKDVKNTGIRINRVTSSVKGENVTIQNAGSAVTGSVGTITIDGLTTENIKNNNIFSGDDNAKESKDKCVITITNGNLCKTETGHNVKSSRNGKIVLESVEVKGTEAGDKYGVIVEKGSSVKLTDVTIQDVNGVNMSAIYSNNESNKVTGTNITVKNSRMAIKVKAGTADIDGLTTEGIMEKNILIEEDSESDAKAILTVANGTLCQTGAHNVHIKDADGFLKLDNVDIAGTTSGYVIIAEKGGDAELNEVTITDGASNAIHVNNAESKVTGKDVTITNANNALFASNGVIVIDNLVTSGIKNNNALAEGGAITVKNSEINASAAHNMKTTAGSITLNNVKLLGTTANDRDVLMAEGGAFVLNDVEILNAKRNAIHVNRSSSTVSGEKVTITGTANNNILVSAGEVELTNLSLGKAGGHNVKTSGGTIALEDAKVLGTKSGSHHAIIAEGGNLVLTDVEISDVTVKADGAAIRINNENSSVTGTNVTISNCNYGIFGYKGSIDIDGLASSAIKHNIYAEVELSIDVSNATFAETTGHNVNVLGGTVTLDNATVSDANNVVNTLHGINVTGGTVYLTDVTAGLIYNTATLNIGGEIKASIYNDAAVTVNAISSLKGNSIVMDWGESQEDGSLLLPAGLVGIQFASAEDAQASKGTVTLGENTTGVYVPYYYGTQMLLNDRNNMQYTVKNFAELQEVLAEIDANEDIDTATITVAGDITVTEEIIIKEGKTIRIQDDTNIRTIKRGADYHGGIITVQANANLTLASSTNDNKDVKLIVDGGSKDGITNTGGCSLVGNNGTLTVGGGVKLANNTSSGNNRGLGVYAAAGSTTTFSGILENIVGTYRTDTTATNGSGIVVNGATVTLNGAVVKNNSTKGSGVIQVVSGGMLNVLSSTFENNIATNEGAAIFIDATAENKVTVENSIFKNNTATGNGGAIANYCPTEGNIVVETSAFTGNEANEGGAITVGGSAALTLADCTFSDNTAKRATSSAVSTAWGNDIRLGGAGTKLRISGKMKAEIFNRNKSVINVVGALTNGSDVVVDWSLDNKVPSDNVGIIFGSDEIMNASKEYISLGEMQSATYMLKFANAKATFVEPIEVATEEQFNAALESISSSEDKIGFIRLTADIENTAYTTFPENCDITITDDGDVRKFSRTNNNKGYLYMIPASTSLTLVSSSKDNANPTLIIDGGSKEDNTGIVCGGGNTLLDNNGTLNISQGVALQNNRCSANAQGVAIYARATSTTVFQGVLRNVSSTYNGNPSLVRVQGVFEFKNALVENNYLKGRAVVRTENNSTFRATNTTFQNNESGSNGSVIFVSGGVTGNTIAVDNCIFKNNKAAGNGGVISIENALSNANYVIRNSKFKNNEAQEGGAISMVTGASLTIVDCEFAGNTAKRAANDNVKSWGNDIRLGGTTTELKISGKIIAEIFNRNKSSINVIGSLTEGSNVVIDWSGDNKVPTAGVIFASNEIMDASKAFIHLGELQAATYKFVFSDAKATFEEK